MLKKLLPILLGAIMLFATVAGLPVYAAAATNPTFAQPLASPQAGLQSEIATAILQICG